MTSIDRRSFVSSVLATSVAALLFPRSTKAADSRIEILLNEPIGTVHPHLYSHFVEHLGGVVYDGIWVGETSRIPNYNGIRKVLVDNLKKLKPGVIRYPGGCFADQYDWRDGVGPRDKRPTRVNFWADTRYKTTKAYEDLEGGPQKYESNHFGTDEFVSFCKMVGAEPYLAANVRSRDVRVFLEWLEYCNAPANLTTWSSERWFCFVEREAHSRPPICVPATALQTQTPWNPKTLLSMQVAHQLYLTSHLPPLRAWCSL